MKTRPDAGPWLAAAVAAAAAAAHAPVLGHGLTNWDDPSYLLDNPLSRELSWDGVAAMLSSGFGGLWQPLSWLSLALDRAVWGGHPGGWHLTSLLLHAATAVLLYAVLAVLFERGGAERERARWAAALGAAFWAVHPLRVESVAWAAERKGVLSAFFFVLAVLAHLAGRPRAALAAFAAALASKVTALSLPLVLLILEVYPSRRLPADPRRWAAPRAREVLLGLAPFALLGAAALAVNLLALKGLSGVEPPPAPPLPWRLGRAAFGLVEYARLTVWPSGLAAYHPPRSWFGANDPRQWAVLLALAASAAALWASRRRLPGAAAAAAVYVVAAAPMLGLVQHGLLFSVNERFAHLPGMALAGAAGALLLAAGPGARVLAAAALVACGAAAYRRAGVWSGSIALWTDARTSDPGALADHMLGSALLAEGRASEALPLLESVSRETAGLHTVHLNAGLARASSGEPARAEEHWRRGLARTPTAELSAALGASWAAGGGARSRAAEGLLRAALLVEPDRLEWATDLAASLERRGRRDAARRLYEEILAAPDAPARAALNAGLIAAAEGRTEAAERLNRSALRDRAARARAHHNFGVLRAGQGRPAEAERHYRAALRTGPLAPSAVNLANLLARRGDLAGAEALYLRALALDPASREARANLAAVRAARGR